MAFRYQLRAVDGADVGEYSTTDGGLQNGDEIRVAGNRRLRVVSVVPVEIVSEFVDRPLYGVLEVESVE